MSETGNTNIDASSDDSCLLSFATISQPQATQKAEAMIDITHVNMRRRVSSLLLEINESDWGARICAPRTNCSTRFPQTLSRVEKEAGSPDYKHNGGIITISYHARAWPSG